MTEGHVQNGYETGRNGNLRIPGKAIEDVVGRCLHVWPLLRGQVFLTGIWTVGSVLRFSTHRLDRKLGRWTGG